MSKNYSEITNDISEMLKKFQQTLPDVMTGFNAMGKAAKKDGALSAKTKELIALSLGVAAHCDGCIGFHAKACAKLGATPEEVMEALGMAVYMGGGPSLMYAADAIRAYEEFNK
ncbi:MAG: alkylhydroperoxidase [Deltaproteobacteria bacterium CG_4_10_14_0_2_um_filter_43_8]|nr:MAG: alkylhydroperoxidase [Deltaproteobacteria bacterium CG11_big_fil_rev_8_21_14_0_20_42_23]PJA19489.1 MAG: alkylhydroperoxidase [Deltaproteobacteria bacterium CG_4_10_14_0_2_um_filter_43_8]PJC63887.1 MAG: alkylhydroperoxidase [Deltaproteobacteria bacterium CG_4_9_14_0_2_um_filter_42_21]